MLFAAANLVVLVAIVSARAFDRETWTWNHGALIEQPSIRCQWVNIVNSRQSGK